MLHQPIPLRPAETIAALDLGGLAYHCMPLPSPSGRPRARVVLDKIKRQASALVKSPTRRFRSASLTQDEGDAPSQPVPTVTFASATTSSSSGSIRLSSSGRPRSFSHTSSNVHQPSDETGLPTFPLFSSSSRVDASADCGNEFTPHLPFVLQLERSDGKSPSSTRPIVPPPSPSTSQRSISTISTHPPVTPVFPDHPYSIASAAAAPITASGAEPSITSAFPPTTPSPKPYRASNVQTASVSEPFLKSKVQIVRRSPIKDSFLLACAAVDDLPNERQDGDGSLAPKSVMKCWSGPLRAPSTTTNREKSKLRSKAPKKLPHLPPLKPPPSCPLPSPPLTSSSDSEFSQLQSPTPSQSGRDDLQIPTSPTSPTSVKFGLGGAPCKVKERESMIHSTVMDDNVEEWTLLLGNEPSKPLGWPFSAPSPTPRNNKIVKEDDDAPKDTAKEDGKEDGRERRAGSVPPSKSKAFLVPPDDATYTRMRTSSAVSGTTRQVIDGSTPFSFMLSNTDLNARTDVYGGRQETQNDADWTLSLPVFPRSTYERGRRGGYQETVKDESAQKEMRKCESWAEWTTTLGDAQEVEKARQKFKSKFSFVKLDWEKKIAFDQPGNRHSEMEREKEQETMLDKKTSQMSLVSASSMASASSTSTNTNASATRSIKISMRLKRQLPIGPTPPKSPLMPSKSNSSLASPTTPPICGPHLSSSGITNRTMATASTGGGQGIPTVLKSSASMSSLQSACSLNSSTTTSLPGQSTPSIQSSIYLPLSTNSHPYPSAVSATGSDSGNSTPASISISTLATRFPIPPSLPSPKLSTFSSALLGKRREARAPTLKDMPSFSSPDSPTVAQGSFRSSKSFEKYIPPSTASSITSSTCSHSSTSSLASKNSRSTTSSSATIKPSRPLAVSRQDASLSPSDTEPGIGRGVRKETREVDEESLRDSLDLVPDEEFDTCTEDGFSTVRDLDGESTISGAWYSARSSLDI